MDRLLLFLLLLVLSGCGSTTKIGFVSNLGSASVNGTVSLVHIGVSGNASGTSVTVTAVTLIGNGTATDLVFCGDQRNQFPINQSVTATYTPGTACATLVSVTGP